MKAVLEEDGTEIDNEYLEFLDPNNAIILLEQQENWTDKDNCNLPVSGLSLQMDQMNFRWGLHSLVRPL